MLKENVVFCGIGQGGGNITRELELNDCQCFYVNTSLEDLDTIDTGYDKKYHINGTKGMAKDRALANEVITSEYNDDKVVEAVYKKYANASIYFFIYTLSGGTGGGMGNQIAKKMKERFPDKTVNIITVLPNDEEDIIMQLNAIQCLKGIKDILIDGDKGYITNLQILDNNKKDFDKRTSINKEYASMLDKILSFQSITPEGNLDEEELERLFSIPGVSTICELDNKDFLDELTKVEDTTIFASTLKNVKAHGLILNGDQNNTTSRNLIREEFGVPVATYDTVWDEDLNIIISLGMSFDDSIINKLNANYTRLMNKRKEIEENIKKQQETVNNIDLDFSAIVGLGGSKSKESKPERTGRTGFAGARGAMRGRR